MPECVFGECGGEGRYEVGNKKRGVYVTACSEHYEAQADLIVEKYGAAHIRLAAL